MTRKQPWPRLVYFVKIRSYNATPVTAHSVRHGKILVDNVWQPISSMEGSYCFTWREVLDRFRGESKLRAKEYVEECRRLKEEERRIQKLYRQHHSALMEEKDRYNKIVDLMPPANGQPVNYEPQVFTPPDV